MKELACQQWSGDGWQLKWKASTSSTCPKAPPLAHAASWPSRPRKVGLTQWPRPATRSTKALNTTNDFMTLQLIAWFFCPLTKDPYLTSFHAYLNHVSFTWHNNSPRVWRISQSMDPLISIAGRDLVPYCSGSSLLGIFIFNMNPRCCACCSRGSPAVLTHEAHMELALRNQQD